MGLVQSIANLFILSLRRRRHYSSPGADENPNIWLGQHGEELAAQFLRKNHYKILYRNFRAPRGGEVDIVCRDKKSDTLAFVEVKTRSSLQFGSPAEAVNLSKQHLISRGALAWLRLLDNPDIYFRFDIVEIVMDGDAPSFNLIRDAFQLSEPYIY